MGTIKTTNIEPIADNGTVTLGSSGDTFSLGSGVLQSNLMNPAWFVNLSADQSVSDGVATKVQFNNEIFDTDNIYDNSSNYRITIPSGKAGKYYIETNIFVDSMAVSNLSRAIVYIYKNNVLTVQSFVDFRTAGYSQKINIPASAIMNLAVGDYIEIFTYCDTISSANGQFRGDSSVSESWFQGFRIGS